MHDQVPCSNTCKRSINYTYHDATFTHNYSAHGPFTRCIFIIIIFMMASGIARCALNAVLDDVNFFKGHPYFKGAMSERTRESVL